MIVRRILVRGVNAPLPPEAKKICSHHSYHFTPTPIQETALFSMFSLFNFSSIFPGALQCFDAVGWAAGRASGLQKLSGGVLAWLSVWSEVQTCICPSSCHCHSLSLASVKSRLVLPFWYRLTWVVPEKGPLNGCVFSRGSADPICPYVRAPVVILYSCLSFCSVVM